MSWSANNMRGTMGTTIAMPTELNFFLEGDLAFNYNGNNYVCDNFMVAQGHNSGENNWWGFSNTLAPLPNIPSGDVFYTYQIQCTQNGIPNNIQTLWVTSVSNDHTLAISDQPTYGQGSVGEPTAL